MLKEISLENFQNHRNSSIEFSPGITAIIGQSCAGKTAIMRGLRWIMDNRPSGGSFISYWNRKKDGSPLKNTKVVLTCDDTAIARCKGADGLNTYNVDDTPTLATVGLDVPEQVSNSLKLNSLNVHRQHDPHFLISMSAGEVAKYLNTLVNLNIIDHVLGKANEDQKKCKARMVENEKALKDAIETSTNYPFIGEAETSYKFIIECSTKITGLESQIASLQSSIQSMKLSKEIITMQGELHDRAVNCVSLIKNIDTELLKPQGEIAELVMDLNMINNSTKVMDKKVSIILATPLITSIDNAITEVFSETKTIADLMNTIQLVKVAQNVLRHKELVDNALKLVNNTVKYKEVIKDEAKELQTLGSSIAETNTTKLRMVTLKDDLTLYKSKLPDVCPLCHKRIGGDNALCSDC